MSVSGNETDTLGTGSGDAPAGRTSTAGLLARLVRKIVATDVLRSGYLLAFSTALTSLLGLIFWSAAARTYTPQEVGIDATLVSLLVTLGNVGQLNMINVLHRFLPQPGIAGGRLVVVVYAVTATCAFILGLIFSAFSSSLGFDLPRYYLGVPFSLVFAAAIAIWTLYLLEDAVLVGLRLPAVVPIANAIYAVTKIVILLALPAIALVDPQHNILLAWVLPLVPILLGVNIYIFRQFASRHDRQERLPMRSLAQFYGWDYVGSLASLCAIGIQPVIVLHELGSRLAASYHFAWMISYPMYLVCRSMGMSIVAEAAANPEERTSLMANALIHTLVPLTLMVLTVIIFAPWLMGFFGSQYAEDGTATLRLFALAMLPWGCTTLFIAWARAMSDTKVGAGVQIATAALTVIFTYASLYLFSLPGAGLAVLLTQSLVLAAVLYSVSKYDLKFSQMEIATALSTELLWLRETGKAWMPLRHEKPRAAREAADLEDLLPRLKTMTLQKSGRSLSGAQTLFYAGSSDAPSIVVKFATTEEGTASLKRSFQAVASLQSDPRMAQRSFALPEVLEQAARGPHTAFVESMLRGSDGSALSVGKTKLLSRFENAAEALGFIAERTLVPFRGDDDWIASNIHQRLDSLRSLKVPMLSAQLRDRALQRIETALSAYFRSRPLSANLAHGDYCPANLIFDVPLGPGLGPYRLNAIIDWDMMADHLPSGFDACHFVIVTRCTARARELGQVVEELILNPQWTEDETRWLSIAVPGESPLLADPEAIACMVMLVWLHHVTNNLRKSRRYRSATIWKLNNIARVLHTIGTSPSRLFK